MLSSFVYGVQSSKSFLVGHRHIEIIGSSKERNKISNNISDRTYKQGQIWLVRRQDFHSFLNLWYGRHLRPGGTVSQIFGVENLKDVLPKLVDTLKIVKITVPNAFDRSRNKPHVIWPLSVASFRLSVISRIACSVEYPFLNPNWYLYKIWCLSMNEYNWL